MLSFFDLLTPSLACHFRRPPLALAQRSPLQLSTKADFVLDALIFGILLSCEDEDFFRSLSAWFVYRCPIYYAAELVTQRLSKEARSIKQKHTLTILETKSSAENLQSYIFLSGKSDTH